MMKLTALIVDAGIKSTENYSKGAVNSVYAYEQKALDQNGQEKKLTPRESRKKLLRFNAYLKVLLNRHQGLLSREEISQEQVPKKDLTRCS